MSQKTNVNETPEQRMAFFSSRQNEALQGMANYFCKHFNTKEFLQWVMATISDLAGYYKETGKPLEVEPFYFLEGFAFTLLPEMIQAKGKPVAKEVISSGLLNVFDSYTAGENKKCITEIIKARCFFIVKHDCEPGEANRVLDYAIHLLNICEHFQKYENATEFYHKLEMELAGKK